MPALLALSAGAQVVDSAETPGITLASSLNPSVTGHAVTLTATVSNGMTGTITFQDSGVTIAGCGTAAITGTTAVCITTALANGLHSITAVYSGVVNFSGAASEPLAQIVNVAGCIASDFGQVTVGERLACTQTVSITASGTAASINVLMLGAANMDFQPSVSTDPGYTSLPSGMECNISTAYTAGENCLIEVTFAPQAPGRRLGAVAIRDASQASIATLFIQGAGMGPLAALTPGIITTFAGSGTVMGDSSHGCVGSFGGDGGPATNALLKCPYGLTFDGAGNAYVADTFNYRVRKVDTSGIITTVVGTGTAGFNGDGIPAVSAQIFYPDGVVIDGAGNLYIADNYNQRIRKVDAGTGIITTVANPLYPFDVQVDGAGNLYYSNQSSNTVNKINAVTGVNTIFAGGGSGTCATATNGIGDGCPATNATLYNPAQLAFDTAGNFYIADSSNNRIRKVDAATGIITTIAGNGTGAGGANPVMGSPATSVRVWSPSGVAADPAGNIYIASYDNSIYKVNATTNIITRAAGFGSGCPGVTTVPYDNCPATSSVLSLPVNVEIDSTGNIFIGGYYQNRIRKINVSQSALNFNSTVYGNTSTDSPKPIEMQNIGTADLTLSATVGTTNPVITSSPLGNGVSFLWAASGITNQCGSAVIASVAACNLGFSFMPLATGAVTGQAVIANDGLSALTVTLAGTGTGPAVAVTSNLNPSVYGQSVTFTASVPSGSTGTINFRDNGVTIPGCGTVTISAAAATCTPSALTAGTHPITAVYSGSTSAVLNQVVNMATPGQNGTAPVSVSSSRNPSAYGESVTFTATVPDGATGTIEFQDDGVTIPGCGAVTISAAAASCTPGTLAVETHPITAVYSGDSNFNGATSDTLSQVVAAAASSVTLTVTPSTVMYGDSPEMRATVTVGATGTVSFYAEGMLLLGTSNVNSTTGVAVFPEIALPVGIYQITAHYNGDLDYSASTSAPQMLTVTARAGPDGTPALIVVIGDATRRASEPNPATFPYAITGQLVNGDSYQAAVTGTPVFTTTAGSTPGSFPITTTGLTSTNYLLGFVDGTLTVTPDAIGVDTSVALTASNSTPAYGDSVMLTAIVAPHAATGTVSFYAGTTLLGVATAVNGTAALTTSTLPVGVDTITAVYNGDSSYTSSTSNPVTVTVAKKPLTVTVQNSSRAFATANPQFSYVVTGALASGDTYATAVTGTPAYAVNATLSSPAGSAFPVNIVDGSGNPCTAASTSCSLSSVNYVLTFVPGTLTIVSVASTTTLTTSTTTPNYGDTVTLTAVVSPGSTGLVVFTIGDKVLGTVPEENSSAVLTLNDLPSGANTITAIYLGDASFGTSVSDPVTVAVSPLPLTVAVNDATRAYGQGNPAFTVTATGALAPGDTYPTAIRGVAAFTTTATANSPVGAYPVAIVGGLFSINYALTFVPGTLTVSMSTLDFTLVNTGQTTQTVAPGSSATFSYTISPVAPLYPGAVSFTVTGLPPDATYTLTPSTLVANAGTQALSLQIKTAPTTGAARALWPRSARAVSMLALLLLPLAFGLGSRRKLRRSWNHMLLLLAFGLAFAGVAAVGLSGCGGGFLGQAPKSYQITLSATSGTITRSANPVTLIVQ
ncbi:MAG: Ig-like domain repeat protein [Acidobacteriaceae bacterium]|nr:Ig-like domain repeat protein [Acidobacteriaceae bacterium]